MPKWAPAAAIGGGILLLALIGSLLPDRPKTDDSKRKDDPKREVVENTANSQTRGTNAAPKWYEGGTLHKKSALEWQTALSKDKLATCADFVAVMWKNGDLRPSINNRLSTVDDVRPYAQELVDFLDAAFKPDPDPERNRRLFANQTVSSTATIGMVTMGWTK